MTASVKREDDGRRKVQARRAVDANESPLTREGTDVMRASHHRGHERGEYRRRLFREYGTWLGVDRSFQNFDEELADYPASLRARMAACGWQ